MLWFIKVMVCICFYLVGIYILSESPEHVVVDANHGIHMFYFVGVYILLGYPEHVVVDANHGIHMS
jgi:hypothetical protein